ncbi:MAG: thioredoxin domain-containing protein [Alphaproteobacteria bacterium]|nr:thioredoxin domain-containing protein [Alphaproteobacteria bacterium]
MKKNILSIVAILLAVVAIVISLVGKLGTEKAVTEVLKNNPAIVVESLQSYENQARQAQLEAAQAVIKDSVSEITNDPNSPFVGPVDAKVTLAVFYDYSCGYCHKLYPVLKDVMANNPDVKFVFKPLTFLGPISVYSAKAIVAANEQGKFAGFNDALFSHNGALTEAKVDELAVKSGVDLEQMKASVESGKPAEILGNISALANKIQVSGVPTMILDGKLLQTFSADEIQSAINAAK